MTLNKETERAVVQQLGSCKRIAARIKILEKQQAGGGIAIRALHEDDQLQALHRKLRSMPSYLYLDRRELELEAAAHQYIRERPAGLHSQLAAADRARGAAGEDREALLAIRRGIERVIAARTGVREGFAGILDRLSELQDLERRREEIEWALHALEEYKPEYARLLRLRYVESEPVDRVTEQLGVVKQTFYRWRKKAIEEYARIAGIGDGAAPDERPG